MALLQTDGSPTEDHEPPAGPSAIRNGENGLHTGIPGSALARGVGAVDSAGTDADTAIALDF